MRFITFLLFFTGGFVVVYYRERIQSFTGNFAWAEQKLGPGGTFTIILLIGLLMSIGSILYITGTLETLIEATIGKFFLH